MITPQEREAFIWMQARMVELLMRYDMERFQKMYDERQALPENILNKDKAQIIQRYRDLAVLFYLRDEMFEHILPRIKRRLSFEAPRETQLEELPARGRIDWQRTARANWRERPTETPLKVVSRKRRRNFATPANLLTVCTLLEYQNIVQEKLDHEATQDLDQQAITHPLNDIVDTCTRELAFLQFAGLRSQCEEILNGYAPETIEDLEQRVEDNLLPGHNSAYADLLSWRKKLQELRFLDRERVEQEVQPMLGADPDRDNYLYQLWVFYELGDMLKKKDCLVDWDYDNMWFSFKWGSDEQTQIYRLQHDQSIPNLPKYWQPLANNQQFALTLQPPQQNQLKAPGVRPDFYISRLERQTVYDNQNQPLWHEPGFVLDAKYYKPRESVKAPSSPVKRMIADLQLTGERNGTLLFAFQSSLSSSVFNNSNVEDDIEIDLTASATTVTTMGELYQLSPQAQTAQYVQPDLNIKIWRLQPTLETTNDETPFQSQLNALIEQVHQTLCQPIEVRCHGVFLDSISTNAQGHLAEIADLTQRNGSKFDAATVSLEDLLLCPKPHIAPWRVDIVNVKSDCCKNPALCHIVGLKARVSGIKPPERLATLQDIEKALKQAVAENSSSRDAENSEQENPELIKAATLRVKQIAQRYAELVQPNMEDFREEAKRRVGSILDRTTLLTSEQRETLAVGCFLQKQIEGVKATNFAGPALLFTGVLEEVVRHTLYERSSLRTTLEDTKKTLGGVLYNANKYQIRLAVSSFNLWKKQITPRQTYDFDDWLYDLKPIKDYRNQVAHQAFLNKNDFEDLIDRFFNSPNNGPGIFDGLLLAWQG